MTGGSRSIAAFLAFSLRCRRNRARFLSPPCEGGVRGGGPRAINDRVFKGVFSTWVAAFPNTSRGNRKAITVSEACVSTPPGPPFTRGGKEGHPPRLTIGGKEGHPPRHVPRAYSTTMSSTLKQNARRRKLG
jgi:hypothetical protein